MNILRKLWLAFFAPPFDADWATQRMKRAVEPIVREYFAAEIRKLKEKK